MGKMIAYLGESQNGHFPAKCSINIPTNLSNEPRIALWIITGLANPGFNACSCHTNSSSSKPSGG
jgi:hypothetical protein